MRTRTWKLIIISALALVANGAYSLLVPEPAQALQVCATGCGCKSYPIDLENCTANCFCFPNPTCEVDAPGACVN